MRPDQESKMFAGQVERVAERNDIPVATVNQVMQSLLRDGVPEDDAWDDLDAWCRIWTGRVK